jgi:hypothetical protein
MSRSLMMRASRRLPHEYPDLGTDRTEPAREIRMHVGAIGAPERAVGETLESIWSERPAFEESLEPTPCIERQTSAG